MRLKTIGSCSHILIAILILAGLTACGRQKQDPGLTSASNPPEKQTRLADKRAQSSLGAEYSRGDDVTNYTETVKHTRLAAEQGDSDSQYVLGFAYSRGRGIAQDDKEAVKWYRLAAEQGHPSAQGSLGCMYFGGKGVSKDYKEAVKWYRLAAEQGNSSGQYYLGTMYSLGAGVAQDDKEAVKWYRLSAEQGDPAGQGSLGWMYASGKGIAQDDKEAVKWYRLSAEQGNPAGQVNLGIMYASGKGCSQDYREAIKWLRLSADQGNIPAQNTLAWIFATCRDPKFLNGQEAVKYAKMATDKMPEWYTIGTLAAAYASIGDFGSAMDAAEKSLTMLQAQTNIPDKDKKIVEAKTRLHHYRNKKPWSEE